MKKFKVPHTYVILCMIIVAVTIGTYLIPAGVYDRVVNEAGRSVVDVNSFHYVESTPVSFFGMFKAVPKAITAAISVIGMIFIIGGSFEIIQRTGAIACGLGASIGSLRKREKLVIPVMIFLFSIFGFMLGAAEEVIPFIPISVMLARKLGYDDIVGVALVSTGACVGFAGGMMNPYTVGIAHSVAELPMYSGLGFRTVVYIILYIITCIYITRYAMKVKADPRNSVLWEEGKGLPQDDITLDDEAKFTGRHKIILVYCFALIGVMVYGISKHGWYTTELGAIFLMMAIGSGIVGGVKSGDMANAFIDGAKTVASGALVVGLARTILIVATEGQIMDSVVHALATPLSQLSSAVAAVGFFIVSTFINFFIPSGSGQAATTMPILVPLADIVGMTRQTATLTFQYGDAFTNQIIPTSGALLAMLGLAKVPYEKWVKYNWKLIAIWSAVGAVAVAVAATINLGPF